MIILSVLPALASPGTVNVNERRPPKISGEDQTAVASSVKHRLKASFPAVPSEIFQ
jgi:hypothetical protein